MDEDVIGKAYDAGWGGVVAKTTALTDTEVVNVQPRYGKLRTANKETVGFQNIELISDRPFEDWEDDFEDIRIAKLQEMLDTFLERLAPVIENGIRNNLCVIATEEVRDLSSLRV